MNTLQSRRTFLKSAGAAALGMSFSQFNCKQQTTKLNQPNIVMILVDDLGYGDLSSYGAMDLKTYHIDKLMASGVRFNNFYANCPVCSPTRASVLTGRYPDLVGVPGVIRTHKSRNFGYLSHHAVMLPSLLKEQGYHTAIFGKWHLGLESPNTPTGRGFDHFHGFLGDMMDDYYNHRRHKINYMRLNQQEIDPEGHATDLFTSWSIDYINKKARNSGPFFLYLAYNAPHTPIQPTDDWLKKVQAREPGISEKRAKLVALIEHLDDGIGKVVQSIQDAGIANDTLIIFTSDNGGQLNVEANNGCLRDGKQSMYEGGLRVPMCAVWPGKIKPGTQCQSIAMTMDLFPTMCIAAGAAVEHEIDGISILPLLLGKKQTTDNRNLFWVRREGGGYGAQAYYAARYKRWKLVQNSPFQDYELFDLENDPKEQHPLPQDHEMFKNLKYALMDHIIEAGSVPWQKGN